MKSIIAKRIYLGLGLIAVGGMAQAAYFTYDNTVAVTMTQLQNGDSAAAQKTAEKELELAKTTDEKTGALLDLGLSYSQRKLYSQAREQWGKIIESPDASANAKLKAHSLIGGSYADESNWSRARAEFQKAAAMPEATTQDKAGLSLAIAGTFFNEKDNAAGLKQLEAIIGNTEVDSSFRAMVSSQLGQELSNERKFEQARTAFNQTLSFPNVSGELRLAALVGIAQSYKAQGDDAKAQVAFVSAQTESLKQMAILAQAKQYEAARTVLQQALTFGTVAPVLEGVMQNQIAKFLLQEGKPKEAQTGLEEYLKKPNGATLSVQEKTTLLVLHQTAQLTVAKAYVQQGNKEQARKVLQTLLNTDISNPGIKSEAAKTLQELA